MREQLGRENAKRVQKAVDIAQEYMRLCILDFFYHEYLHENSGSNQRCRDANTLVVVQVDVRYQVEKCD